MEAEKKFGFYLVGRKIKHFFAAAFGNGGTQVQRGISARAATAAGTGPRISTSRSVSGAVRVAIFFRSKPEKKGRKKASKNLDCKNKNVYLCSRFERGESAGDRKFIEEI